MSENEDISRYQNMTTSYSRVANGADLVGSPAEPISTYYQVGSEAWLLLSVIEFLCSQTISMPQPWMASWGTSYYQVAERRRSLDERQVVRMLQKLNLREKSGLCLGTWFYFSLSCCPL